VVVAYHSTCEPIFVTRVIVSTNAEKCSGLYICPNNKVTVCKCDEAHASAVDSLQPPLAVAVG
jgi:hypothetical protein